MYTHLYVSKAQALRVISALGIPEAALTGPDPVRLESGIDATMESTLLPELFINGHPIQQFGHVDMEGPFVLKFPRYLPRLPQLLDTLDLQILVAEIVRLNSAPTKAQAGYYEDKSNGFFATVERVVPTKQRSGEVLEAVYAENIRVAALSLEHVQHAHTRLSEGKMECCYLVNAFE